MLKTKKIKNIEEAAERIKKAVENNERIILYGDSDLDGISSVVILKEAIQNLGGKISSVFFPDRERDGYGINSNALKILKDQAPALFITLDLGIGNFKEVKTANEMGFEIIIVDHHETLNGIPSPAIVVDPKQLDDKYPFKGFANVGLTYKLAEELLGKKFSNTLKNSFLEITALGTIADMVPETDENKVFIEKGLRSFKNTFRPGLKVFFDILGRGAVFSGSLLKVISALNAAEGSGKDNSSFMLLTCSDPLECRRLADGLLVKTRRKQQEIKDIVAEVERRIIKKEQRPVVFEGDPSWRLTLAGSVASIISQKYSKPVFIFKKGDQESCGSVRNPEKTNSVDAMKTCAEFLLTYGGHAQASGFRIKNEDLEKFEKKLNEFFA